MDLQRYKQAMNNLYQVLIFIYYSQFIDFNTSIKTFKFLKLLDILFPLKFYSL